MRRALVLTVLAFLFSATESALAVAFGVSSLPLVPGVLFVAYAALVDPPLQAAVTATMIGLVVDALSGTPVGLNVLACQLSLLVGRLFVSWVQAPRGLQAIAFTAALSAGYHLFALTLLFVFSAERKSFGFWALVVTAVANGLFAAVIFPITQRLLVALNLEEKGQSLTERLGEKRT